MAERKKKPVGPKRGKTHRAKHKTALVLQGGASRGAYQVGAMRYLDEIGVKPDIIIGSSIGVINACLYATGGVEKMVEFWTSFQAHPILAGLSLRENIFLGNSLLSMQKGFEYIESFFDFQKILRSRTEISFVLTNLSKGSGELRSNRTEKKWEDLRTIARIGYTIPGLYPPIKFRGDYWCDGGFVCNVPVEHALRKGATRIFILLCIGRALPSEDKFNNIYQVLTRFYDVMWVHVGSAGILQHDFTPAKNQGSEIHIVEPTSNLEGFGMMNLLTFDPAKAKGFIEQGYRDAREQVGKLR